MDIKTIGVDLGKTWFHVVGCNRAGKPVARQKLTRSHLLQFVANLPVCLIGMEACPGSQHFARAFQRCVFQPIVTGDFGEGVTGVFGES